MANYYFVVSSLPLLFYEKSMPITVLYFLEVCKSHLHKNDFKVLENAKIESHIKVKQGSSVYKRFQEWDKSLRNALVVLRAGKKGVEAKAHLVEGREIFDVDKIARQAFEEDSPLKAEDILDRGRWQFLDDLEMDHFFDIEKLISYYLKLQILERKALFDFDKGKENFENISKSVNEKIRSGVALYE